jgi:predicted CXXCH cytochrome family protein
MQKPLYHRTAILPMGLGLVIMLILFASCEEPKRQEVLTFFFDGVPVPKSEQASVGPVGPNAQPAPGSVTGGWFVHQPLNDCTNCHVNRRQRTFSRQVRLVAEVPELCYRCHQQDTADNGWVHGPVAAGECLLCHEPHKTRVRFLLKKAVPDLCYSCHDQEAVAMIDHHDEASYAACLTCHEGHVSPTRSLLRAPLLQEQDEQSDPLNAPKPSGDVLE